MAKLKQADAPVERPGVGLSDRLAADELRLRFQQACERVASIRDQIQELRQQEIKAAHEIDQLSLELTALEPNPASAHALRVREYQEAQNRVRAARREREQQLLGMGVGADEVVFKQAPIDAGLAQRRPTDRPNLRGRR